MNRRNFLAGISALVGGLAVNEAIPFGRVWSFPSKIVVSDKITAPLYFPRDAFAIIWPTEWKTREELLEKYPYAVSTEVNRIPFLSEFSI